MFSKTLQSVGRMLGLGPTTEEQDRRIWGRVRCDHFTRCYVAGKAASSGHEVRVRNLSLGGAGMLSPKPYHPGTLLSLLLPPPEETSEPIEVLACVVRCDPQGDQYELGCTFAGVLDEDDLARFGARKQPAAPTDQRQWVRYECKAEANYQIIRPPEPGLLVPALVRNISASGVSLEVSETLRVGDLLSLELIRNGEVLITTLASVVRTEQGTAGQRLVGCNFIRELDSAILVQLA
ncbi:MAG: PilZ domain-containing protein [Gemmataceae bacterium]